MSEEHIKTVVLDPPLARRDDASQEERRGEQTNDSVTPSENPNEAPLRSWLT
ncbi:MAG: hypothetical protein HKN49_12770 [Gammaproteobacteria bacterium]|nr:hypothetical protein [Gammaproteobacteria bacterium]